jgi:hypothetical protein
MKHNREHQRGMLKERPIFVLIRERAGTQSRTRINALHDSEQTKSAKNLNGKKESNPEAFTQPEAVNRPPDTVPRASLAAC